MPSGELVGLVPAAGRALRLGPLPCSKEVLPVGVRDTPRGREVRVACDSLFECLRLSGAARAFVVLRDEKWDVARYLGPGDAHGLPLAYVCLRESASLPESLDRAQPFVLGSRVALGFPDVLLGPSDALARVAALQAESGADLALGLFPARRPETTDMVEVDAAGRVVRIEVRPAVTALRSCWLLAVWGPRFTEHLHDAVAAAREGAGGELQIGAVVAGALAAGLDVRALEIPDGWYRDVGTPEELAAVLRQPP